MNIYKYPLKTRNHQKIKMPYGARILAVGDQNGQLVLWAQVIADEQAVIVEREIRIFGTGHTLDAGWLDYIGTVQMKDQPLVWHIYEGR